MKPQRIVLAVLLVGSGMLLGALLANIEQSAPATPSDTKSAKSDENPWPPLEFNSTSGWAYLKVDETGWSTGPAGRFQELDRRLAALSNSEKEIVIPIFPTVYEPKMVDKIYYDAILESDIKPGHKVLIIGTGSGADAWAAWLKSKAPVYVVEINPLAVANARATARLAHFEIHAVAGEITSVKLPEDFRDFDFVLWNMPFVWSKERLEAFKKDFQSKGNNNFHDGDDGSILKKFLAMLPALLKKDGKAIVLNGPAAVELIPPSATIVKTNRDCVLFVVPNP